jgi:GDPmannose 4,6-dehydratase
MIGTMNLLECIRLLNKPVRFYNAGSSEVFGNTPQPATETTPFHPRSPYATAKAAAHYAVANYREAYGLHASTGILFNHESPLRPNRFVTSKIVTTAVRISQGSEETLHLGKIDLYRDWGWAPDYVEAMWLMLQQGNPDDYAIATGEEHSIEDFVATTFEKLGLDWRNHVKSDKSLFRPSDIEHSCGNPEKARKVLGWEPKHKFDEIIKMLIEISGIKV